MAWQSKILNWDDLRIVLAVAECGTISGAAAALRISHPTLSRRLRSLEQRLGVRLFERRPTVCSPTEAGEEMRRVAARLRDEIAAVEGRIAGRDQDPCGPVRLTAPDAVAEYLLPGMLAGICRQAPELTIELLVSNQVLSLARRSADIALRVTDTPDPALRGRRVGTVAMAVYGAKALASSEPTDDGGDQPWVGYDAALACTRPGAWVAANVAERCIRFRANTLLGAARAVHSGIGFGLLPCFVGGSMQELVRITLPIPALELGLWLLVHPDMSQVRRIRTASDALARKLKAAAPLLTGECA
ncbi:LysR family transcriptional regulator [Sinorhizobium alkalisoli]|uniref:LysR family transcriptional regulator n=1 Tax=Sinorhizobium alkalisoli TaxID=1752398 RepID=A0A1E3V719_9HYPH|nr:LysR family transcriptional regulator [Sinorhizobium alkalisoli]MCA1489812.1 LysR family transcriptional regulator [Ensifer sp. NBAIM29]MCG5481502.1 LysR family transcriptional regulator [Sinorhizobium alkalisoli]ODR89408.1 LysR family transcriptional regulator [Sinorhizobium alkalisoli]